VPPAHASNKEEKQNRMLAMLVDPQATDDSMLHYADVASPEAGAGEILVRTAAAGVNRADALQRSNKYRQPALERPGIARVAGMEVAGTVSAVGVGVTTWAPGDRVIAMCGGSYAEVAVVDHALAMAQPEGLSDQQAASLPVALMTAYDALVLAGGLQPGQCVLITAAASAVGLVACQIALALGANLVLGLSRGEQGRAAIAGTGAVPVGAQPSLRDELGALTGGRAPDLVIDHVGGDIAGQAINCMALGGRLVSVGRLGGRMLNLDLNELARKRLTVVGTTFRTRNLAAYRTITAGVQHSLLPLVASRQIVPTLDRAFDLPEANEAIDYALTSRPPGKVVLDLT